MIDLNDTTIRFSPEDYERFLAVLDAPIREMPPKMRERLSRKAPWVDLTKNDKRPDKADFKDSNDNN